jgi:hypothetical protein
LSLLAKTNPVFTFENQPIPRTAQARLPRAHQLNSIFAIFRVSDHGRPLVLKGRCL